MRQAVTQARLDKFKDRIPVYLLTEGHEAMNQATEIDALYTKILKGEATLPKPTHPHHPSKVFKKLDHITKIATSLNAVLKIAKDNLRPSSKGEK